MNLDRFNQALSWEGRNHDSFWDAEESNEIKCAGCGEMIYISIEDHVEIDTEEFIHDDAECFKEANEKSSVLGNRA